MSGKTNIVRDRTNRRTAFTLVELLVVMGIIALLMGIFLPSLAASKEQANAVICATRLDQIFKATFMYAQANDESLPFFGWAGGSGHHAWSQLGDPWWPAQISGALNGLTEVYRCPSDPNPYQVLEMVRRPGGSLAMSKDIEPGRFAMDITYRGSCDLVYEKRGSYVGRRITDWDRPSDAVLLLEATVTNSRLNPYTGYRECFRFEGDLLLVGTKEWFTTSQGVDTWERHGGSTNFLYLDGTGSRHKPQEIPAIAMKQEYWGSLSLKRFDGPKRRPSKE